MSSRSSMAPAGSAVRGSSMYGSSALARPATSRPASAPIRAPAAAASFGDVTSNRRAAEARIQEEAARARQHRAATRAVAARYQQRPPRPSSAREPRHYERPLSGRPASARREVDRSARAERERRLCGGDVVVTSAPSPAALTREEQALLHRAPAPAPSSVLSVPMAPAAPAPAPAPPARPQSAHQAWASPREPPQAPPAPPERPQSARQASVNPHQPPPASVVDPFKVRIRVGVRGCRGSLRLVLANPCYPNPYS